MTPLISTLGWDINAIVARSPNFHRVKNVHCTSPDARPDAALRVVEKDGDPLIITGWNRHPLWPKSTFSIDWLRKNGDQNPTVRNIHNWSDFKIPLDDLIKKLREIPAYASADESERLYGKDGDCPPQWTEWLKSGYIPDDFLFHGPNDFLQFLPDKAKVQTLMCYMGIGDTFTPFHKDLCASSGQNLMCFSEHSGSAFWFMTKSSAAPQVAAYFHQLGQEVDLETHVVTIEELANAPFDVYIAEQQIGDLVLVPPRSCHQVVNKGGITIKASWSRMSLGGLQTALWHELPIYHRVCRREIYKVKSNIFHALQHFTKIAEGLPEGHANSSNSTPAGNLKQLVYLFDDILTAEFSMSRNSMPHVSQPGGSHTDDLHCDFCGADIFQSFFECDSCLPASSAAVAPFVPVGDGLVLCPSCYVEGRTCHCGEMQPVQCRPFSDLLEIRDRAVRAIQRVDKDYDSVHGYLSEQPLRLLSGRGANIFEAGCRLFKKRQTDPKATRSCRVRMSHSVPAPAAIYCKSCHCSKCYTHLLESDSIHSVDAIILNDRHDGDANWHQFHRDSLQQYPELRRRVVEDEEWGSRPNMSHRLIYLAKTFTTYRTLTPDVTKHGWYDRDVQSTSIPIAQSSAKALIALPDDVDDELHDSHTVDGSSGDLAIQALENSYPQTTDSLPASDFVSPEGVAKAQSSRESSLSAPPDSLVDPTSPQPKLIPLETLNSPFIATIENHHEPSLPLSVGRPPMVASLSTIVDDPGDLSDLTDLPTELDSPPRSSIVANPAPDAPRRRPFMESSHFPSPVPATFPNTQLMAMSQLKPRLVFDGVEIPQVKWHGRREKVSSSALQKRKRIIGTLLSDNTESPDADNLPLPAQGTSSRSPPKRKRKMPQGPASRLPSSFKCTRPLLATRDRSSPNSNNFLANALNQTFQLNSTSSASHVATPPGSFDHPIPPVITPIVKPQYRDIGVQKNINFTRNSYTTQPAEDMSTCIIRLEADNRELRAQAEMYKRERATYRDNLGEIQRRYTSSGSQRPPPSPSHGTPLAPREFSSHPRWRTRNVVSDSRPQTVRGQESDHPPIETLPTPSSPESISPSNRRRTPVEPRSHRMRGRGDVRAQPYPRVQQYSRRRGPPEPPNRRERIGPPFRRSGRVGGTPTPPSSPTSTEAGVPGMSPGADVIAAQDRGKANDQMPPSPPSTASDQPLKSRRTDVMPAM